MARGILFVGTLSISICVQLLAVLATEIPQTLDFGAYVDKYGKDYGEAEALARAQLFYARTLGIFKLNSLYLANKNDHYLKQNEFTDMTPIEVGNTLLGSGSGLTPVHGADLAPDMPADEFMESLGRASHQVRDGYSRSSGEDHHQARSEVDFFGNVKYQDLQPKEVVRELASNTDVAKKMAKVLEFQERHSGPQFQIQVPYKPLVPPSNKHYDPSLVPSYAWFDQVDRASNRWADVMMEDFLGNLDPYPEPEIPTRPVLTSETEVKEKSHYLVEVMSSIKNIYNFFALDGMIDIDMADDDPMDIDENEAKKAPSPPARELNQHDIVFDIDWRRTGCVPRPKSQSKCNACYAFATLDLMEFFYCRQKNTMTEFSVQYVIDCGSKADLNGCQGGKLSNVGVFIQKYGLQLNAAYPYNALEHTCPYEDSADTAGQSYALKPTITGWRMFPEIQAWYKWLPKSPLIVGINMPSDFLAYGGGVHDGKDCTPGMVHAMLLVGSGKQDGKTFWLLKNTFSDSWGEEGYFKLSKRAPIKCFNSALVARAKFHDLPGSD